MATVRLWARLRIWLSILGFCIGVTAASSAVAQQNQLPTSSNAHAGYWTKMHPSSFPGTVKSAYEQCQRNAGLDSQDALTMETCREFQNMLLGRGLCEWVIVKDGIVHDFMNGRTNGHSKVTRNVMKKIGREDKALVCILSGNIHAYWYTGVPNQSCNNVGFTFVDPPAPPPQVQTKQICRFVKREVEYLPGMFAHVPDIHSCGCYVPGFTGMTPGGIQTSSELECEQIPAN